MDLPGLCSTSYSSSTGWASSNSHQRRLQQLSCRHFHINAAPQSQLHSHRQRVNVGCGSQSRRFRHEYNPSEQGITQPPFLTPDEAAPLVNDPEAPPRSYWARDPPGSFRLPNPHGQRIRLQPAGIPVPPGGGEEYFDVDMQSDNGSGLPRLALDAEGKVKVKPGFLQLLVDPAAPSYVYAAGVERFQFTLAERAVHTVIALLYAAAGMAALTFIWERNYNLAAILFVNWARDKLSLGRLAGLLALAWIGKLWLYWVFFAAGWIDRLLQQIAPPIRKVAWTLFTLWIIWVAVSPLHEYPLPFPGWGPFSDPRVPLGAPRLG